MNPQAGWWGNPAKGQEALTRAASCRAAFPGGPGRRSLPPEHLILTADPGSRPQYPVPPETGLSTLPVRGWDKLVRNRRTGRTTVHSRASGQNGDDEQKSSGSSASRIFPAILPPPKLQGVTCLPGARLGGRGIRELLPGALGRGGGLYSPDPRPRAAPELMLMSGFGRGLDTRQIRREGREGTGA